MTRSAVQTLTMVGGFVALLVVTSAAVVQFDGDGVRGAGIGVGLGLVNLAVGCLLTRRALRHGMKSVMATLAGGFAVRLFLVAGLVVVFQRTGTVDPAAFALTFLVLFFVYLGIEVLLVEQSLAPKRRAL